MRDEISRLKKENDQLRADLADMIEKYQAVTKAQGMMMAEMQAQIDAMEAIANTVKEDLNVQ